MHPRRLAWLLALVVVAGCRAERSNAAAPSGADASGPVDAAEGAGATAAEDEPPDCGAHGREWDGRLDGCTYEYAGCCYDTPEAACTAAGCAGEACRILEASPAQLYCES